jgi:REP element-mobilizing transposase RayT
MPQWRLPGGTYFATWSVLDRTVELLPEERSIVLEEILKFQGERYQLDSVVVMNDHVHVLLQTFPEFDLSLDLWLWKGASAAA